MRSSASTCHHNYAAVESHLYRGESRELWITRKGAIRAGVGELGLIPGSMGTRSFVGAWPRQCRELAVVQPWRRPAHESVRGKASAHRCGPTRADERARVAVRSCRPTDRRDPFGVQRHRRGHGRAGRPRGGRPYASSGAQLQGHETRLAQFVTCAVRNLLDCSRGGGAQ